MQYKRHSVIFLVTLSLALAVSACGRKGDLYLPDKQDNAQNRSATTSSNTVTK